VFGVFVVFGNLTLSWRCRHYLFKAVCFIAISPLFTQNRELSFFDRVLQNYPPLKHDASQQSCHLKASEGSKVVFGEREVLENGVHILGNCGEGP
jgi:hypothetical protein